MKKPYKVIIIVAFIITGGNFIYSLFSANKSHFNRKKNEKINFRYQSRMQSEKINGVLFDNCQLKNIITNQNQKLNFDTISIVILLSKYGCSDCQNRELRNLESLNKKIGSKVNVIGIFDGTDRNIPLKLRKVNMVKFNLFWGNKRIFNKYSISNSYPQIFIVERNLIVSSFLPIPNDDDFSTWYFKSVEEKILGFEKKTDNNLPKEAEQLNIN